MNLHEHASDAKWVVCHAAVTVVLDRERVQDGVVAQPSREKTLQVNPNQRPVRTTRVTTVKKQRVLQATTTVTTVEKQQMPRKMVVTLYESSIGVRPFGYIPSSAQTWERPTVPLLSGMLNSEERAYRLMRIGRTLCRHTSFAPRTTSV